MFEAFKAAHGGLGPVQSLVDRSTGGELSNRIRLKAIGAQMDETLASIKADPNASEDFKTQAAEQLRHGVYTGDQALKNIESLRGEAKTQNTITTMFAPVMAQAQTLYDNASDPLEKQAYSSQLANLQAAHAGALDPATRKDGMALFATAAQGVAGLTTKAKEDAIAADVRDAQEKRDLDNTQYARNKDIREDHQRSSLPFYQIQNAFRSVQDIAGLKEHTTDTDAQLARLAGTIFNPGVAVRPGENAGDEYYNAFNSVIPGLGAAVKFAATGNSGFTDHDRDTLLYALTQRAKQENIAQSDRNTQALAQGKAAGLPDKYLNQYAVAPMDLGELGQAVEPGSTEVTPKNAKKKSDAADPNDPNPHQSTPSPIPGINIPVHPGFENVPGLTQMDRIRRLWDTGLQRQDGESLDAYGKRIAATHKPAAAASSLASIDEYGTGGAF